MPPGFRPKSLAHPDANCAQLGHFTPVIPSDVRGVLAFLVLHAGHRVAVVPVQLAASPVLAVSQARTVRVDRKCLSCRASDVVWMYRAKKK